MSIDLEAARQAADARVPSLNEIRKLRDCTAAYLAIMEAQPAAKVDVDLDALKDEIATIKLYLSHSKDSTFNEATKMAAHHIIDHLHQTNRLAVTVALEGDIDPVLLKKIADSAVTGVRNLQHRIDEMVSVLKLARSVCYNCTPRPQGVIDRINQVMKPVSDSPTVPDAPVSREKVLSEDDALAVAERFNQRCIHLRQHMSFSDLDLIAQLLLHAAGEMKQ